MPRIKKKETLSAYCMPGMKYKPKYNPHLNNKNGRDRYEGDYIIGIGCEYFKIERDTLLSKGRKEAVVYPRQCVIYVICLMTDTYLTDIAKMFNKKDHSTIIHARQTIQDYMDSNAYISITETYCKEDIINLLSIIENKKNEHSNLISPTEQSPTVIPSLS